MLTKHLELITERYSGSASKRPARPNLSAKAGAKNPRNQRTRNSGSRSSPCSTSGRPPPDVPLAPAPLPEADSTCGLGAALHRPRKERPGFSVSCLMNCCNSQCHMSFMHQEIERTLPKRAVGVSGCLVGMARERVGLGRQIERSRARRIGHKRPVDGVQCCLMVSA